MLSLQARSLQSYYLYTSDNAVQPPEFIGNKVAGILFENKIDHTTYFGTNIEYIQGIHMLPVLPHAPMVRTPSFVHEEWETYFGGGRADAVQGGWRGILYANYATVDPKAAYRFFSQGGFDPAWLDGGASLTWYLCYSAGELMLFFGVFPWGRVLTKRGCSLGGVVRLVLCWLVFEFLEKRGLESWIRFLLLGSGLGDGLAGWKVCMLPVQYCLSSCI